MNSPPPLKFDLPPARYVGRHVIEATVKRLETEMIAMGAWPKRIQAMKEGYIAGLYAAAAAVSFERAHSQEISEAAWRIENER